MLDRTIQPRICEPEQLAVPSPECRVMKNGIPLYILNAGDNEVERIERAGTEKEVIYIIEVESAQDIDMDLHYSANGILIKAVNDDGNGNNESLLP